MAFGLKRPMVLAAIACAAVAVAYLPPTDSPRQGHLDRPVSAREVAGFHFGMLREAATRAGVTLDLLRQRDTLLEAWDREGHPRFWVRDPDGATGGRTRRALDSIWAQLPHVDSTVRVVIAIRRVRPGAFEWEHSQVWYLAPHATDGHTCIVSATLPPRIGAFDWLTRFHGGARLLGVCAFYGAFGLPGQPITEWLAHGALRFAFSPEGNADSNAPASIALPLRAWADARFDVAGCRLGQVERCSRWMLTSPGTRQGIWLDRTDLPMTLWWGTWRLTAPDLGLLGDLLRGAGPIRFARFWRADAQPDRAFAAAFGIPMGAWLHDWSTRVYGPIPRRDRVRPGAIVVSLGCIVALVGIAVEVNRRRTLD